MCGTCKEGSLSLNECSHKRDVWDHTNTLTGMDLAACQTVRGKVRNHSQWSTIKTHPSLHPGREHSNGGHGRYGRDQPHV